MKLHDVSHPLWPLLRLVVMMVALTIILKSFATTFDATEIKTICIMFFIAAGTEGTTSLVGLLRGKKHGSQDNHSN